MVYVLSNYWVCTHHHYLLFNLKFYYSQFCMQANCTHCCVLYFKKICFLQQRSIWENKSHNLRKKWQNRLLSVANAPHTYNSFSLSHSFSLKMRISSTFNILINSKTKLGFQTSRRTHRCHQ